MRENCAPHASQAEKRDDRLTLNKSILAFANIKFKFPPPFRQARQRKNGGVKLWMEAESWRPADLEIAKKIFRTVEFLQP